MGGEAVVATSPEEQAWLEDVFAYSGLMQAPLLEYPGPGGRKAEVQTARRKMRQRPREKRHVRETVGFPLWRIPQILRELVPGRSPPDREARDSEVETGPKRIGKSGGPTYDPKCVQTVVQEMEVVCTGDWTGGVVSTISAQIRDSTGQFDPELRNWESCAEQTFSKVLPKASAGMEFVCTGNNHARPDFRNHF